MKRLVIFFLWLVHFLPTNVLVRLGYGLGHGLYWFASFRRHVTLTNLRLCFPELAESERVSLAKRHFGLYGRTLLERTVLWWGSEARVRAMARVEGLDNLHAQGNRPVILFAIHFVGMDLGWTRMTLEHPMSAMYARVKDPFLDRLVLAKRGRFGDCTLVSNKEGVKEAIRVMQSGKPLMYLPDMDFGRKHSLFVPFFATQAATIPGLSRLAASTGAAIVPTITRLTADGWVVKVDPAWQDFPTADVETDTRRMNAWIEEQVREYPEQYWWTHKRFKTRPPGEPSPY